LLFFQSQKIYIADIIRDISDEIALCHNPEDYNLIFMAMETSNYNSVALVRKRTTPTERPPPVAEVSAIFCG
jgi:hypothetical protein